tara:strand:- start:4173 stop:4370 length:198 start_codon:yes stop_codon:yes gene_type:complete
MGSDKLLKEMARAADVQNEHLENIAISLSEIADCLSQFLDFVSVVNFDELQAREEAMKAKNEKRL